MNNMIFWPENALFENLVCALQSPVFLACYFVLVWSDSGL